MDFLTPLKTELNRQGVLYLRLKVHPGAKITGFKSVLADDTIKVDIAAPPEGGRANRTLLKFLASSFSVKPANIILLSGAADRIKLIKITK